MKPVRFFICAFLLFTGTMAHAQTIDLPGNVAVYGTLTATDTISGPGVVATDNFSLTMDSLFIGRIPYGVFGPKVEGVLLNPSKTGGVGGFSIITDTESEGGVQSIAVGIDITGSGATMRMEPTRWSAQADGYGDRRQSTTIRIDTLEISMSNTDDLGSYNNFLQIDTSDIRIGAVREINIGNGDATARVLGNEFSAYSNNGSVFNGFFKVDDNEVIGLVRRNSEAGEILTSMILNDNNAGLQAEYNHAVSTQRNMVKVDSNNISLTTGPIFSTEWPNIVLDAVNRSIAQRAFSSAIQASNSNSSRYAEISLDTTSVTISNSNDLIMRVGEYQGLQVAGSYMELMTGRWFNTIGDFSSIGLGNPHAYIGHLGIEKYSYISMDTTYLRSEVPGDLILQTDNDDTRWSLGYSAFGGLSDPAVQYKATMYAIDNDIDLDVNVLTVDTGRVSITSHFDYTSSTLRNYNELVADSTGIRITYGVDEGGTSSPTPKTLKVDDAGVRVTTTTGYFRPPLLTATQASALTPEDGAMIYVTDTNGTFTSIGFWGYVNGAWAALN